MDGNCPVSVTSVRQQDDVVAGVGRASGIIRVGAILAIVIAIAVAALFYLGIAVGGADRVCQAAIVIHRDDAGERELSPNSRKNRGAGQRIHLQACSLAAVLIRDDPSRFRRVRSLFDLRVLDLVSGDPLSVISGKIAAAQRAAQYVLAVIDQIFTADGQGVSQAPARTPA